MSFSIALLLKLTDPNGKIEKIDKKIKIPGKDISSLENLKVLS